MFVNDGHPSFLDKPDSTAQVWRYIDLPRYLSLLETSALHFARADQMSDRWEGSFSVVNKAARPFIYGDHSERMFSDAEGRRQFMLQGMHMNCWHLAEYESAAMWNIYQREGRGVAIRTTWGRLTSSITADRHEFGAKIKYADYSRTFIPEGNAFDAFMHKRQSFSHEQEVRLIMQTGLSGPHLALVNEVVSLGPEPPTIAVDVNLPDLITDVFVAPDAPEWIAQLVESVTRRYGYSFPVRQSDLSSNPVA